MRVPRIAPAVLFVLPWLLAEDKIVWAQNPDAVPVLMDDNRLPAGALLRAGTVRLRHGSVVTSLSYSKDGKTIVSASWDTTVRLWDAATLNEVRAFSVARSPLRAAALSPDGKLLASGGWDRQVRLSDATTGKALWTAAGHGSWIDSLAFSPDGKRLASSGRDGNVFLWEAATGPP